MAETPIGSIAAEIERIAVEHGYEGPTGMSIVGAMDALADTLAGEDVHGGATIAEAVRAIAPHIGSGGGGTQYGENYATIGYSYTSPLSPDFTVGPSSSATPAMAELWDIEHNKPILLNGGVSRVIADTFLDGSVAVFSTATDAVSGPIEAALFTFTSVDLENESVTFDTTPYEGVTYDSETHRFIIPVHDIPAPLHVEANNFSQDFYPQLVFFVQVTAPTPPI